MINEQIVSKIMAHENILGDYANLHHRQNNFLPLHKNEGQKNLP